MTGAAPALHGGGNGFFAGSAEPERRPDRWRWLWNGSLWGCRTCPRSGRGACRCERICRVTSGPGCRVYPLVMQLLSDHVGITGPVPGLAALSMPSPIWPVATKTRISRSPALVMAKRPAPDNCDAMFRQGRRGKGGRSGDSRLVMPQRLACEHCDQFLDGIFQRRAPEVRQSRQAPEFWGHAVYGVSAGAVRTDKQI